MSISTADIKLLRESTGAGILDCKKALQETGGNIDEAIELLRKKGLSAAAKKASREAKEGEVNAQVSEDYYSYLPFVIQPAQPTPTPTPVLPPNNCGYRGGTGQWWLPTPNELRGLPRKCVGTFT